MLYSNRKHQRPNICSQQGLAIIEFILALPVLLMLTVLVIDVSRAFIQYTEVNKALQNGARYAVVDTYGTLNFESIADETSIKNVVVYGSPIASTTPVIDLSVWMILSLPNQRVPIRWSLYRRLTITCRYSRPYLFRALLCNLALGRPRL